MPLNSQSTQGLDADAGQNKILAEKKTQATLRAIQKHFIASIQAFFLGLVLLATVTFAGFLQPPGGTITSNGGDNTGHIRTTDSIQVFIVCNSLSFFFAMAGLLLCVGSSLHPLWNEVQPNGSSALYAALVLWGPQSSSNNSGEPMELDGNSRPDPLKREENVTELLAGFVASTLYILLWVNIIFAHALVCCVGAFVAASFAVTSGLGNRVSAMVTTIGGSLLFVIVFMWVLGGTSRYVKNSLRNQSLTQTMRRTAQDIHIQVRYLD